MDTDMTISWNMEPTFTENIISVRLDKNGSLYLEHVEGFELTISPALVNKIREVLK